MARHWQSKNLNFSSQFQSKIQVRGAELCAFYLGCIPAFYSQLGFYVLWLLV